MKWNGEGVVEVEQGEPAWRSCWECNSAHEHLKSVNSLHMCFECGRYWVFDRYLDTFTTDEEFDAFFASKSMERGGSTRDIDAGYRVTVIELKREP